MNQRQIALDILYKTINESSYSNILLRSELNKVDEDKRPFITNLVYGVLEKYESLKYQIEPYCKSVSLYNELILLMSLYEKFFLNKEDYVTVNEYVDLAKNEFDKSFINAVLRKINEFIVSDDLAIRNNLPKWIYDLLSSQYNEEDFFKILQNFQTRREIYYHINHSKCDYESLKHLDINIIDDDFFTSKNSLVNSKEFNNGLFYIQDINSAKIIDSLELKSNEIFLDACSAPGSKLFNALKYIKDHNAYANDINETRINLIKKKAETLGFKGINYLNWDASELKIPFKFNKILIDAPCSGIGVIGRKPDIKFHLKCENLDELENIQANILKNISTFLSDNGVLCYSTCTLNKKENSRQIASFIKNNPDFKLIKEETIINVVGDIFYYALIRKV